MSTTTALPQRSAPAVPRIVSVPPGAYPCGVCGVAVQDAPAEEVERVVSLGRVFPPGVPAPLGAAEVQMITFFARCLTCRAIRDHARALLAEHPRVEGRIGSARYAVQKVENALDALDLIGASSSWIGTDAALLLAVEHLSAPGGMAQWRTRYVPFARHDVAFDTCTTTRWADASHEVRQLAREGLAAVLRHRVDRPVVVVHPEGSGCAFCGVSEVEALSSRRDEAWVRRSGPAQPQHGVPAGEAVLCWRCDAEAVSVGSFGRTALARAFLIGIGCKRALTSLALPAESLEVVAWGAIPASRRPEPSKEPWSFIENRAEVAARLGAGSSDR
ncbi:hypothetical protein AAIB33_08030 [Microbacterium sp. AZCO]|uniref:hypothetical protein n=1 Tax=Microbacterium sp. AZCO TaxID=3142976 RepID=UPI0031F41EF5